MYDYIKYVKQTKKITNDTLFDIINAHNNIEKNNKSPTLFIPYFLKICDIKKYTYNFLDDKCNNKLNKISGLLQSELLKEIEFIGPIIAQEIRDKIYPEIDHNKQQIYDFKSVENRAKNKNVKQILMILEFSENMDNIIINNQNISQENMKKNIEKLIQKSTFFTDKNAQLLFLKDSNIVQKLATNFNNDNHCEKIINFINTYILRNYGLHIKVCRKYIRIKNNSIAIFSYELNYINNINLYV